MRMQDEFRDALTDAWHAFMDIRGDVMNVMSTTDNLRGRVRRLEYEASRNDDCCSRIDKLERIVAGLRQLYLRKMKQPKKETNAVVADGAMSQTKNVVDRARAQLAAYRKQKRLSLINVATNPREISVKKASGNPMSGYARRLENAGAVRSKKRAQLIEARRGGSVKNAPNVADEVDVSGFDALPFAFSEEIDMNELPFAGVDGFQ